jgi:hypothetical protein
MTVHPEAWAIPRQASCAPVSADLFRRRLGAVGYRAAFAGLGEACLGGALPGRAFQPIRHTDTETTMPRHIRSVTARRPRRIARTVRDVPAPGAPDPAAAAIPAALAQPPAGSTPDASIPGARAPGPIAQVPTAEAAPATRALAASLHQVELFENLRRAFQVNPDVPETPERTRERYVWAIESMAEYLEVIGADALWVQRIDELGWALEDLTNGLLPPLLQPLASKRRMPPQA